MIVLGERRGLDVFLVMLLITFNRENFLRCFAFLEER